LRPCWTPIRTCERDETHLLIGNLNVGAFGGLMAWWGSLRSSPASARGELVVRRLHGSRTIRRMRRLLLAAVFLALPIALPTVASAASYEYLTTYTGVYGWADTYLAQPNAPDGLTTNEHYSWTTFDYDKVTAHKDGTFSRRNTRYIAASGHYRQVDVQGSAQQGGPFVDTDDCSIASALNPVSSQSSGSNVQPVPVSQNPSISVGWEIPDYGGGPQANDAPKFTVAGTLGNGQPCATVFSSRWLVYSDSGGAGTVFAQIPLTQKARDAFGSATNIKYDQIRGGRVWRRQFKNIDLKDAATRPGFQGPATDNAELMMDTEVTFRRVDMKTSPNKIGALLLREGFLGLGTEGKNGGPAGNSDEDEDVIVPGLGAGDVTLDVQGHVASASRAETLRAAPPLLSSGHAKATGAGRPVKITLHPTASGATRLHAPHPAISARYVLTFKPKGSKQTYSVAKPVTLPAVP
jgi:hypothetical protein